MFLIFSDRKQCTQRESLTKRSKAKTYLTPTMTNALVDRVTHHYLILETGNESYRFKQSSETKAKEKPTPPIPTQ